MKKAISFLLTLILLFSALPLETLAFAGDIWPTNPATVEQITLEDGALALQNGYIRVALRKFFGSTPYLTTVPTAKPDGEDNIFCNSQIMWCNFIMYESGKEIVDPAVVELKKAEFTNRTPNGSTSAIKAEYSLLTAMNHVTATMTVYYELVQLKESGSSKEGTWGVLSSVSDILIDKDSLPKENRDFAFTCGYSINGFTGMGHSSVLEKPGGPAIKMSRTTVPEKKDGKPLKITTENSVFTAPVENLDTKTVPKGYSSWGDVDGVYITEAYVDAYPWANPFAGLSDYYEKEIQSSSGKDKPIRVALPTSVSVEPGDKPINTRVAFESRVGFEFSRENISEGSAHFLWGFRELKSAAVTVPSEPDKVDSSIYAKQLAAFADSKGGVRVEPVADGAALEALKKQYGASPIALINGDYESKNGEAFTFTGGAAMLSPSVAATWDTEKGSLVIHRDGRVEQKGVSLNAPTFKFYQPKSGEDRELKITLVKEGFQFGIDPNKNDAIVFVDIPYASVKLEQADTDTAGNLVFNGHIGFQTIFDGAEFSLTELGYGLNEKHEFKVNGIHATGKFNTASLIGLELAEVEGEVNTFKGRELYAFSLKLNAMDLFETEAELALVRSKKDGSLLPDNLWFYVKASPGIVLIPPIPVGQLNGGGAGFKNLASTVNGDYFAIPPIKLRGALTGTYMHLIEGTGNVVLGPSEISLKATDVGLVGTNASIVESFGYSLKLEGQERSYKNVSYKGVYFVGSKELEVALPSTEINVIKLDSAIRLGAFGGVNNSNDQVYLGIGANGTVGGRVQIPENIRAIGGLGVDVANINLIVGGQTTFPIRNVSVEEGMKQAFENVDVYIGAMAYVGCWLANARVWVLVPQIVETDFRKGGGWDIEVKVFGYLPEWNWEDKGVTPIVQGMLLEDSGEDVLEIYTEEAAEPSAATQEAIEQETAMPESTTEGNGETATETPSGTPVETPSGAPVETPSAAPVETPSGAPVETPSGAPVETSSGTPALESTGQEEAVLEAAAQEAVVLEAIGGIEVQAAAAQEAIGGTEVQEEAMPENTSETKTEAREEAQESEEETTVSGNTAGTETEEAPASEEDVEDVEDVSKRPVRKAPAPRNGGRIQAEITVDGGEGKTPYILLAFDGIVTEEEIKNNLKIQKDSSEIDINWIEEGKDPTDPNAEINATIIANMKKSEDDGKVYHLALMRLKEGGTYSVSAENGLSFTDEKGIDVEPFEELKLNLDSSNKELAGQVKHPAGNTTYVLRTYFANTKGGADYLIDERQIDAPDNISVSIPTDGALAPTGSYYVTSFLMMEKTADLDGDGVDETALAAIANQQFDEQISYRNSNQPGKPQNVTLELAGNEVMSAGWEAVTDADGYAVRIYQQKGSDWVDTGFGYDLDKETTAINMALTVGGEETGESKNLSANETYKVGVRAYRTVEKGKYYSEETFSADKYLPEYQPLDFTLKVNGTDCTPDENGVFHAYIGGASNTLSVSSNVQGADFRVTRMDKDTGNVITSDGNGQYTIPDFEGSLMLRIDGITGIPGSSAEDVTSKFLLVSRDDTAPMLTLSDPMFYADRTTGKYQITGMADAGSEILYGKDGGESTRAAADGSFTVTGVLDDSENSDSLYLTAKDSAGNESAPQLALIARQTVKDTATENGSHDQNPGAGERLGSDAFRQWKEGTGDAEQSIARIWQGGLKDQAVTTGSFLDIEEAKNDRDMTDTGNIGGTETVPGADSTVSTGEMESTPDTTGTTETTAGTTETGKTADSSGDRIRWSILLTILGGGIAGGAVIVFIAKKRRRD